MYLTYLPVSWEEREGGAQGQVDSEGAFGKRTWGWVLGLLVCFLVYSNLELGLGFGAIEMVEIGAIVGTICRAGLANFCFFVCCHVISLCRCRIVGCGWVHVGCSI